MTLRRKYQHLQLLSEGKDEDVVQYGTLRKLKSMSLKFIVLRAMSSNKKARLEFYPSERKYQGGYKADKTIFIFDVLSVEKAKHSNHHFLFTIFVKCEKVSLVAASPEQRDSWIDAINSVKSHSEKDFGNTDFVWDVKIKDYGIAKGTAIAGDCRLKKCSNIVKIVKRNSDDILQLFFLSNIRRSGYSSKFVLFEIGRSHVSGPGEFWIEAVDTRSAEDIYTVLFGCKFARPKTCVGVDRGHLMPQNMTVRRGSDGAENGKIRKKSSLFPFLKSRNKGKGQASDSLPGSLESRRSLSASDLHKIGAAQDDELQKLLLKYQTPSPVLKEPGGVTKHSTLTKVNKRISWLRERKNGLTRSVENIHSAEVGLQGTLPNNVSRLTSPDEKYLSRSEQNLSSMGRVCQLASQAHSSHLSNIRSFNKLQQQSASDNSSSYEIVGINTMPHSTHNAKPNARLNARHVAELEVGAVTRAALLKKNKLKGIDNDSPGVSSEESGSVCSNSSNYSLDSLPPHDVPSICKNVSDEEYMRMDYKTGEATVSGNTSCTDQQDNFMLITPDNLKSASEVDEADDTYMNMKDGNSYDSEGMQHGFEQEASVKRRSQPQINSSSQSSWSSNEGSVFSSGPSESQSPIRCRPVPLPPRTKKLELNNPNTNNNTIFTSVVDDNPIPLPPKASRQFSNQSAASDEERTGRFSPRTRRVVDYNVVMSDDLEEPPPRCHRPKDASQIGIEKRAPLTNKYEEVGPFDMDKRDLPPLPTNENSPSAPRGDRSALMNLYATVNKESKNLSKASPTPVLYQRELSKQSVKSDGEISPISVRKPLSPHVPETTRELRSFSEMSPIEYEEISPVGTTGKKPKALWKEWGKRVTLNFKQDRRTKRPPKSRPNGSTSHFYVDVRKQENHAESQEEEVKNDRSNFSTSCINEQFRKPAELPVRPNFLDLTNTSRYETVDLGCGNVCPPSDAKADDDDSIDPSNVRKYPEAGRNLYGTRPNQVISDNSAFSKHIQQKRTGRASNYETVYTEIELKDKDNSIMPRKGFLTLTKDKKSKAKVTADAEEKIAQRQSYGSDEETEVFQRKPSQKILSSPTKDGKGFESISLRDEVITTPLDEIEGRPYMNLGFHKNKGKTGAEKRRSADDAAIKMLMNLQNEKKIGDELSARRKNNADTFVRKCSVENDENDEVSYVNVGKDGKLVDRTGRDITPVNVKHRRASEQRNGEGSNYQNIGISTDAKKVQGFDHPTISTADALTTRENTPVKQESNNEHLYSNIGFGSGHEQQSNVKRDRPQPAPRTKKPERIKISQSTTKEVRKLSEGGGSTDGTAYGERGFSPPHGHIANAAAHTNVLASFGISEASYVNVGSGGYQDGFDAGGPNVLHHVAPKGQNYVNVVQEDFQPRRQRKKSAEWDLAYADVMVIKGKEQTVEPMSGREGTSPDGSENNSPRANVKDPSRSRCAYTEIDFMKSHGISEAVRERRVESFDESYAD